jgi:CP family cyanate transporter-like MFS transporter
VSPNSVTTDRTYWPRVWIAFIGGCIAAFQVGKASAALSVIIEEFQISLFQAGLIVSLLALISASTGLFFGEIVDRYGPLRMAVLGLAISAVGSFIGAATTTILALLFTRVVEGAGYILAIVALPPLIRLSSSARDSPLAMGLWGAFMPAGISISMICAPWITETSGWRGLWIWVGSSMLVWCVVILLAFRGVEIAGTTQVLTNRRWRSVFRTGPLLLFGCFVAYSMMYGSLTSFFPILLIEQHQANLILAAQLGALVVAANIIGNIASGWMIRSGIRPNRILTLAYVVMALSSTLVFIESTPVFARVSAGILFSAFGGLIPGTMFATAPRFSNRPTHIASIVGLLLQGAGIGQTIGPIMVGGAVDVFGGWQFASLVMIGASLSGLVFAFSLRKF